MLPAPTVERKIIAVIPAFNEENTIEDVVIRAKPFVNEVIVVNDGSTDRTEELARRGGAHVLTHKQNQGLGITFKDGLGAALSRGASVIVTLDGDGQFRPDEIPKVVAPVEAGQSDMVTGTRFAESKARRDMSRIKNIGNLFFTRFVNRLTGVKLTDTQCGFRAYSSHAAVALTLFGQFTYTQEVILNLATKGFRISEVPISVRGQREHGASKVVKSPWKYGFRVLNIILRAERDYRALRFFGSIGLGFAVVGALQLAWVLSHWLETERTSPYTSLLVTGGASILVAVQVWVLALVADAQSRNRALQDETLVLLRWLAIKAGRAKRPPG